jgi:hypothetical protein
MGVSGAGGGAGGGVDPMLYNNTPAMSTPTRLVQNTPPALLFMLSYL